MRAEDWIDVVLEGKGRIPLARILEKLVALPELREVAGSHGIEPKGFRVERARAAQLAPLLAEAFLVSETVRRELAALLEAGGNREPAPEPTPAPQAQTGRLARLEGELDRIRRRADKEQASAVQARKSRQEAIRARERAEHRLEEARSLLGDRERRLAAAAAEVEALRGRLRDGATRGGAEEDELRSSLDELRGREEAARHRIAELMSRIRDLEEENTELESLLPRGQRERRRHRRKSVEAAPPQVTLLPRFEDGFFRCLDDLEADQERKVHAAIARLILQGFDYPGLHAKALRGRSGLWSIRAGEHLRVYFLRDGDVVTFEGAATREEQPTYLKKRRDG